MVNSRSRERTPTRRTATPSSKVWVRRARVGSGGFAVVHSAVQKGVRGVYALKELLGPAMFDAGEYPTVVARFKDEVAIQQRLKHPNVIRVLDAHLDEDPPWYVMEWGGDDLDKVIAAGPPAEERTDVIFKQTMAAIEHAHENGVVHRDLHPGNVLIDQTERVRVVDFGLGRNMWTTSTRKTKKEDRLGRPHYIAPEQIEDPRDADERSDVFSLGKILQFMLTGTSPVRYDDGRVSQKYAYFVSRATAEDPGDRYPTVGSMAAAFGRLGEEIEEALSARERLDRLVDGWGALDDEDRQTRLERIDGVLRDAEGDTDMVRVLLPRLPNEVLAAFEAGRPLGLRRALRAYDEVVGSWRVPFPFVWLDPMAEFSARAFFALSNRTSKRRLLARMVRAGSLPRHEVGVIAIDVLARVRGPDVLLAEEVLREDPDGAAWLARFIDASTQLPGRILRNLRAAARERAP